jgi:nitrous oxidase accessory protein
MKFLISLAAAGLIAIALHVPIWQMSLEAPQYPKGLKLVAYGNRIEGDLREINIINHYVGMETIEVVPAPEMALYPYALYLLLGLCLAAPFHRRLAQLALAGILATGVVILADLQWWLHDFGQNLHPGAPIRVEPFTPLALGTSTIGNFKSTAFVSWGYLCFFGAAVLVFVVGKLSKKKSEEALSRAKAAGVVLAALVPAYGARAAEVPVQGRIDAAPRGSVVYIESGVHQGAIVIHGPLTLRGAEGAILEGTGVGNVVTILGDGVVLEGLTVRKSGREVSEEAAGIKVEGSDHLIRGNRVEDVYFGIHFARGRGNRIEDNVIVPGERYGARPGHGVSLWYQEDAVVRGNRIDRARDGIYLSFVDGLLVEDNEISRSRYGVHSMYSKRATFRGNRIRENLLGAALMYSEGLTMTCNRIELHREGASAYGVLLKDIADLVLERNELLSNRVGIYADSTPLGPGRKAFVRDNTFAGNDAALALQSNVALTFAGNRVENNLTVVRTEGGGISRKSEWTEEGRGNYWDDYRGFDRDGDGVGDLPYQYEAVMNEMMTRSPLSRAFLYTPAHVALESGARLFPVYRPAPLVVDDSPLMQSPETSCAQADSR